MFRTLLTLSEILPETCGTRPRADALAGVSHIIGGNEIYAGQFPWQIGFSDKKKGEPWCGGSLISNTFAVSAAHCFADAPDAEYWASFGDKNWKVDESREQFRQVKPILHKRYNHRTSDNDIALVQFDHVEFTDYIQPICLDEGPNNRFESESSMKDPEGDAALYVSGWGNMKKKGEKYPQEMMYLRINPINREKCNQSYYPGEITENMLCAGVIKGGKDSCQGDSGGPLAWQNVENDKWTLYGVVSWGAGCADKNQPGVYVNVNAMLGWIKENMGDDSSGGNGGLFPTGSPVTGEPGNDEYGEENRLYLDAKLKAGKAVYSPDESMNLRLTKKCNLEVEYNDEIVYESDTYSKRTKKCFLKFEYLFEGVGRVAVFKKPGKTLWSQEIDVPMDSNTETYFIQVENSGELVLYEVLDTGAHVIREIVDFKEETDETDDGDDYEGYEGYDYDSDVY